MIIKISQEGKDMGADKIFDCESFKAISTGDGCSGGIEEELADRREEFARQYERMPVKATTGQIDYIHLLLNEGWIDKSDFKTSKEFHRKKSMSMDRANELIRLGKKRKVEDRHWKNVARERGW